MTEAALSLTEGVFEALRADILACRVLPGSKLKIGALCDRFGVSLGAVREALSRLTAEGLVTAEAQRGFRVAPVSAADLLDLTAARIDIEVLCLRRAIAKADIGWESEILSAFHRLSRTPERDPCDPDRLSDAWSHAHGHFHRALVAGCASPWLMRIRDSLYAQSERYRQLSVFSREERDVQAEHQGLVDAALAHDADLIAARIADHFSKTTCILLAKPHLLGAVDSAPGDENAKRRARRVSVAAPLVS